MTRQNNFRAPWHRAGRFWLAALATMLAAACTHVPSNPTLASSANGLAPVVPRITVPTTNIGNWYDLGTHQAPWLTGDAPVPSDSSPTPTRVVGLQDPTDGRWLAIVIVQRARAGSLRCPLTTDVHFTNQDNRYGRCLRIRHDANFDGWFEHQNPVLTHWLRQNGWQAAPRTWVAQRTSGNSDIALEAMALIDPMLIEPVTRNNDDFLVAGRPGRTWARAFAQATERAARTGSDLHVPAFPYAARSQWPHNTTDRVRHATPVRAEQIQRQPRQAPRRPLPPRADRQ